MGYTIWILLLPFISFVMLGLGGSKMKPKAAGVIGTASLVQNRSTPQHSCCGIFKQRQPSKHSTRQLP